MTTRQDILTHQGRAISALATILRAVVADGEPLTELDKEAIRCAAMTIKHAVDALVRTLWQPGPMTLARHFDAVETDMFFEAVVGVPNAWTADEAQDRVTIAKDVLARVRRRCGVGDASVDDVETEAVAAWREVTE